MFEGVHLHSLATAVIHELGLCQEFEARALFTRSKETWPEDRWLQWANDTVLYFRGQGPSPDPPGCSALQDALELLAKHKLGAS